MERKVVISFLASGQYVFAFCEAARCGLIDLMEQCLTVTETVNCKSVVCGGTPLHYACSGCSREAVCWLMSHGADVLVQDSDGTCPAEMIFYGLESDRVCLGLVGEIIGRVSRLEACILVDRLAKIAKATGREQCMPVVRARVTSRFGVDG